MRLHIRLKLILFNEHYTTVQGMALIKAVGVQSAYNDELLLDDVTHS